MSDDGVTVIAPHIGNEGGPLKMRKKQFSVSDISKFYFDMKLAGGPLQCNETDGTCDEMK
jgi:hypothetical protein